MSKQDHIKQARAMSHYQRATWAKGPCSHCGKIRVLVTCPCRSCDRLEAQHQSRWRVCKKCAQLLMPV